MLINVLDSSIDLTRHVHKTIFVTRLTILHPLFV